MAPQKTDYRSIARQAVARAETELNSRDDSRLRYCALELRLALEALVYSRAQVYEAEFPESLYETWQPRKLLSALIELDPAADRTVTLSVGVEKTYGVESDEMQPLGTEINLTLKDLKNNYDAIGSYLHMETPRQIRSSPSDYTRLRERCETVLAIVNATLSSPVWNINFKITASANCARCNKTMKKRFSYSGEPTKAKCFDCGATYTLRSEGSQQVRFEPNQTAIKCANPSCGKEISLWEDEVRLGACWNCEGCKSRNTLCMCVECKQT